MKTEVLASVRLDGGVFELVREVEASSSYDAVSGASALRARLRAEGKPIPVESFRTLAQWAAERRVDLSIEVAKLPAVFAQLAGAIELGLRVVELPALYDFLEDKFGIGITTEVPRVEGNSLLFVAGNFGLGQAPAIWRVTVDLTTGAVEQIPVPPLHPHGGR